VGKSILSNSFLVITSAAAKPVAFPFVLSVKSNRTILEIFGFSKPG